MIFKKILNKLKNTSPKKDKLNNKIVEKSLINKTSHSNVKKIIDDREMDKSSDLNYEMVNKFLNSIIELVRKAEKAKVDLSIEFKNSVLHCDLRNNGQIVLRSIRPKDSQDFSEIALFSNKAFLLKDYLYDNIRTNEDIVELEKTMIRLI